MTLTETNSTTDAPANSEEPKKHLTVADITGVPLLGDSLPALFERHELFADAEQAEGWMQVHGNMVLKYQAYDVVFNLICASSLERRDRGVKSLERAILAQATWVRMFSFYAPLKTLNQLKKLVEAKKIAHKSGVPIRSVVLLRTMSDPVIVSRWTHDYATGKPRPLYDARTREGDPAAARAYVGGNNHHIEIRVDAKGNWTGEVVSTYEAAQRKLAFFRALRKAGVPRFKDLKALPKAERRTWTPQIAAADKAHPLVDRTDDPEKGGRFVMSLCEGEMVFMRHKERPADPPGYFVVAKLDKPRTVVLVPHWDARTAGERKDNAGKRVADSAREQFAATPSDLAELAPPGSQHAVKVRVSPLGDVEQLEKD